MTTEIDKLAWLHVRDRRVLGARSKSKSTFYVPGGKREPGETDEAALVREIKEELSVDLVAGTLSFAHVLRAQADGKPEGTMVKLTLYRADYHGEIAPAAEIEDVVWLVHADKPRCSLVTQILLDWLKENGEID